VKLGGEVRGIPSKTASPHVQSELDPENETVG
jgi:hypothetical protein